jgi:hypothetical protein
MALRAGESRRRVLRKGPAGLSLTATTYVNVLVTIFQEKKLRSAGFHGDFPGEQVPWPPAVPSDLLGI